MGGPVLYDRAEELEAMARALDDHGELVLLEGPAGIGKTSLVHATRAMAEDRSLRVLAGRGAERERQLAFGVVRQLFEPHMDAAQLTGAAALARHALEVQSESAGSAADAFAVLHG